MARMQRRRRFVNGSGRNRPSWWARSHNQFSHVANTPTNFDLLSDYKTARGITSIDPGTTVSGGWVNLVVVDITAPASAVKCAFGIIVVDENLAAQVPNPLDDPHADWMFYWVGFVTPNEPSVKITDQQSRWRSRRRMDEIGMNLYGSFDAQESVDVQVDVSTLLKLR